MEYLTCTPAECHLLDLYSHLNGLTLNDKSNGTQANQDINESRDFRQRDHIYNSHMILQLYLPKLPPAAISKLRTIYKQS
jgi:hypothetical protein